MESELLLVARQRDRSCTFEIEGLADNFWVVRFTGSESISSLYEFHLDVVARHIDVGELVGRGARLKIVGTDEPRHIHGMIIRAEYAGEMPPRALYRITLVPTLYTLLLRSNSRIFQQKTTQEIVKLVLEDAGLKPRQFRFELTGTYKRRDYCVQYRENDLQFISRLMEEDGIVYFFEHTVMRHVLVISDRSGGAPPVEGEATLPFHVDDMAHDREHVRLFRMSEEIRPNRVSLRDFNLHQPDVALDVDHHVAGKPTLELYDYPGEYQDASLGQRLAKTELEAAQAVRRVGRGVSDSPRLVPGFAFTLDGHPRVELDGNYCLLRTNHSGEQPDTLDHTADQALVYRAEFTCIPSDVPFRQPRVTPRPVVRGVQTATVVGPAGEEVHVDEHGRVKVQFHWDRAGKSDEHSSCWVRVSQAWAGNGYGSMFIPRIGHEVIVDFIEGDPDRPIITGRVYHGLNTPPYPLPDQKTKSTIKTETYTGGGFNELRFEDAKAAEQVFVHAQRDLDVYVRNDRHESIVHDEHHTVDNDRFTKVGHDEHRVVTHDRMTQIGGDEHRVVAGRSLTRVDGEARTQIGGDAALQVAGKLAAAVAATADVGVGGQTTVSLQGGLDLSIVGAERVSVLGPHNLTAITSAVSVSGNASAKAGGAIVVEGTTLILKATAGITLQGPGGFVTIDASGVSIEGTMLRLNSGGAALVGVAESAATPESAAAPGPTVPTTPRPAQKAPNT